MRQRLMLALLAGAAVGTVSAEPPHGGGGIDRHAVTDHMPLVMRMAIERELEQNALELRRRGQLPAASAGPVLLEWPLRVAPDHRFVGYHGTSNFVDLDPAFPNHLLDYECGRRTYDLAGGYNHAGIDYFLWPYPWRSMDEGNVAVVAAAAGTLIGKHDGHPDRSCGSHTGSNWNAVYVQHADGSVAWYGHLVRHSLTDKPIGAAVAAGEYLGLVGSSGISSGPHLHLELRGSSAGNAEIIEPHAGSCRAGPSRWVEQRPYHDTELIGIASHDAAPSMAVSCPNPAQEAAHFADAIEVGATVYLSIYFRDELPGADVTTLRLFRPDGSLHQQWTKSASAQHFAASWWWWGRSLGVGPDRRGEWRFEVSFRDQTLEHRFLHGMPRVFADGFE